MSSWPTVKLGEVADVDCTAVSPENIGSGVFYVGLENIKSGGEFVGVRRVLDGELASNKFLFTSEHVLFGKLRPYLSKIATPDFSGVCSTDILPILPKDSFDKNFLAHYLRLPRIVKVVSSKSTGANLPRFSAKALRDLSVPMPKLPEQKHIAAVLDKVQALRDKRLDAIRKLDYLALAVFIEMFGDPDSNPQRWRRVFFGSLLSMPLRNGLSPSTEGTVEAKVLTLSSITGSEFSPREFRLAGFNSIPPLNQSVDERDFLICRGNGNRNLVGIGKFPNESNQDLTFPDTMIAARVDFDEMSPMYLDFLWKHSFVRRQIDSAVRTTNGAFKVNQNMLKKISLLCPPMKLQNEFSKKIAAIQKLEAIHVKHSNQLEALFASLQHRAFRGEL